jgi:hypothetical protein
VTQERVIEALEAHLKESDPAAAAGAGAQWAAG